MTRAEEPVGPSVPSPPPPGSSTPPPPPIDLARGLAWVGGDRELFGELVGVFLEDVPGQIATLRSAIHEGQLESAARVAHSLKSVLTNLGAPDTGDLAAQLETLSRKADRDQIPPVFAALERELGRIMDFFEAGTWRNGQ